MALLDDDALAELSIEERNRYLDYWMEEIKDPVWIVDEDAEERRLYEEHCEQLSRERWSY